MLPATHSITLTVNGETYTRDLNARVLLADFLRHELRLTGTHVGCAHGACGACTVMLDGKPVRSCLMFAIQAGGSEICTIEGLAEGENLSSIQEAFRKNHSLQCGFCTPGMLVSAVALLQENASPSEEEIRQYMAGNLCRCTGYGAIVKAIKAASCAPRGS